MIFLKTKVLKMNHNKINYNNFKSYAYSQKCVLFGDHKIIDYMPIFKIYILENMGFLEYTKYQPIKKRYILKSTHYSVLVEEKWKRNYMYY